MSAKDTHKKTKPTATSKVKLSDDAGDSKARPQGTSAKDELSARFDAARNEEETLRDRTGGQNGAVDQKRNDEQQYHAGGAAHDPHNKTQERVDRGDPDAGDIDETSRDSTAPYNKTYGHHT